MTTAYGDWIYYTSYCALRVKWDYTDAGASCAVTATLQRWDRYANAAQGSATLWMTDSGSNNASFAANGNNETKDVVSLGSHTFSKSHSTYSISATAGTSSYFACITDSGYYRIGEQMPTWYFTIPTKWNYAVSYNANGGTGAPSSDTKWHDEALTLSSSTPSKEGHTFGGWNTNSSGTGTNYAAGASYTENAPLSLYAKWSINTYTVTFDANGGTGAPSAQPKTWGTALTLSANKPTRTNYKFLGWATSASATSAQYCTGSNNDQNTSYTTESDITLYAVWELAYVAPKVTNLKCFRCDASGNAADEGTQCYVSFTYVTDTNISSTNYATVTAKVGSNAATTLVAASAHKTGTNTYAGVLADTGLDVNSTYSVTITVTDAQNGSTTSSTVLSQAFFTMDFLEGGHGVAIGKPATTANLLDVGMASKFTDVTLTGTLTLPSQSAGTALMAPPSASGVPTFRKLDVGGRNLFAGMPITGYTSWSNGNPLIVRSSSGGVLFVAEVEQNTDYTLSSYYWSGMNRFRVFLTDTDPREHFDENYTDGHYSKVVAENDPTGDRSVTFNSGSFTWVILGQSTSAVSFNPNARAKLEKGIVATDWTPAPEDKLNVPTVLYDNASGTTGTVTLSQTAANFDHMRIYAKFQGTATDNFTFCSTDVCSPNGKRVTVMCAGVDNSGITCLYLHTKDVLVSGTSITVQNYGYSWFQSSSATSNTVVIDYSNYMYITRVEAWNEGNL